MQIISVKDAREQKLQYYYTGIPCKHGHISKRIVDSGTCYECAKIKSRSRVITPEEAERRKIAYPYEYTPARKNAHLTRKYGITLDQFAQMLNEQNNCCAICKKELIGIGTAPNAPCVDHCHTTTKVRAILCTSCNKGLGMMQHNKQILQQAIVYLEGFEPI